MPVPSTVCSTDTAAHFQALETAYKAADWATIEAAVGPTDKTASGPPFGAT